jgi:outer membrane protein OmpA-like peptidoglycan-associated protein
MKNILTFLVVALLISGCNSTQIKPPSPPKEDPKPVKRASTCDGYKIQVSQAVQATDLDQLVGLLAKSPSECSVDYLNGVKRNLSEMAAARARNLVQRGQLSEAEKWLQDEYVPIRLWTTQEVRGKIAATRKQWKEAAWFYNQSLELIDDSQMTPNPPPPSEIKKLHKLALETQFLAGTITTTRGAGLPISLTAKQIGDVRVEGRIVPVQFIYDKDEFTDDGRDSAEKLASYLVGIRSNRITLIGHTDRVASDAYNCELSKKRANALKQYLVEKGVSTNRIAAIGKGKREPYDPYDPSYTQDEIDQFNRRVEFFTDDEEVSYANACN